MSFVQEDTDTYKCIIRRHDSLDFVLENPFSEVEIYAGLKDLNRDPDGIENEFPHANEEIYNTDTNQTI